jgi:hypothetical protein
MLRTASKKTTAASGFQSKVFGNAWDGFVEEWAPVILTFVSEALGPYGTTPLPVILPLSDGMHAASATASFNLSTGQVHLSNSTEGKPGQILEKLTHEFIHGSLAQFPEGDPFYDESYVDYSTWILAHAPVWKQHKQAMIEAAEFNIKLRRERAFKAGNDYDRKRWAGGIYVMTAYGPLIINRMRMRKLEGNFTW